MTSPLSFDPIALLGAAAVVPEKRVPLADILESEKERYRSQLESLQPPLRERLGSDLGIEALPVHSGAPSELGLAAAKLALERASISASSVGLIIDFSTLPGDHPAVWSLANWVQAQLGCEQAWTLGVRGAGCAGFHLALRTAQALMRTEASLDYVLLVASDCVSPGGRCCLPISVLGDGASALVLARQRACSKKAPTLLSVECQTLGAYHHVVVGKGSPMRVQIDGQAFESHILPLHFLLSHRVLGRALRQAGKRVRDLDYLVYPNTTALDRTSASRALGIDARKLCGPGPGQLGHVFASDMLINYLALTETEASGCVGLLGVGAGFTWGAAVVQL